MKYFTQILILISALTLWIPVFAKGSGITESPPLVLSDSQDKYQLGQHMDTLEDSTGKLAIEDVISSKYSDQFIPSRDQSPNFGFTDSAYWVRFRLRNESLKTDHWLLEVNFPNIHYVDLYLPAGEAYISRQTGVLRAFNTRDIPDHHIVFNLPMPPEKDITFYMRFQSGASMTLPLTLWLPETFFQESANELLFLGMCYGVLLIMLVYNLFLLYSLREASYLYYVCFLASGLLLMASYDALAEQYLWPDLYAFNRFSVPLFFILIMASIVKFTDVFLETKTRNPKLHRLILFMLAGWGIALLLLPFVSYRVILSLLAPYGVLSFGVVGAAGIISWRGGYRPARYFLFSFAGLIIGGSIVLLVRLGLIPSTAFTEQVARLGILWLVAFWAIALVDRINLLKAEMKAADFEEHASEARYRQLVETMNDGLGVTDKDGRYTYVNNRLAGMFGYPADELVGHLMTEFVDEENKRVLTGQLEKRKKGVTTPYELTWRRKDGSDLFTIISPMALMEQGSQYKGAFAVVTDISEHVQASRLLEQRVTERTRELSTLLEISHEITTTQGLDYLLNRILETLNTVVDYRDSAILLFEEERWRIIASRPANLEQVEELPLSTEEARELARTLEAGKPVLLNNPTDDEDQKNGLKKLANRISQVFLTDTSSWLGIPLLTKDFVIGLLILGFTGQDGFSDDKVKVAAAFANQAAIMIEKNQLLDQIQTATAADERSRIARELHDSVTQTLFTASVMAEATPRIWDKSPATARQNMEKISVLIRGALAEMRSLLFELRSGASPDQTLGQLLNTLAEATRGRSNVAVSINIEGDREPPPEVTMAFYRVVREALNNVIIHAEATRVEITLINNPDRVELYIRDDGRGFDPRAIPAGHLGISIMAERAKKIGGDFQIQSRDGHGAEVIVTWPYPKGRSSHD